MNEAGSNRRLVLAAMCALHLSVSGCIGDLIPDRPDLAGYDVSFPIPSPSTFPNFRAMPPVTARLVPATAMNVSPRARRVRGTCGTCPAGTVCSLDYSICLVTDVLRPAGSVCGQNAACEPKLENPVYPGTYYDNPDWPACTGYQCRLVCDQGLCSAACEISVDQLVNGTDVSASDGIEDDVGTSDCPSLPEVDSKGLQSAFRVAWQTWESPPASVFHGRLWRPATQAVNVGPASTAGTSGSVPRSSGDALPGLRAALPQVPPADTTGRRTPIRFVNLEIAFPTGVQARATRMPTVSCPEIFARPGFALVPAVPARSIQTAARFRAAPFRLTGLPCAGALPEAAPGIATVPAMTFSAAPRSPRFRPGLRRTRAGAARLRKAASLSAVLAARIFRAASACVEIPACASMAPAPQPATTIWTALSKVPFVVRTAIECTLQAILEFQSGSDPDCASRPDTPPTAAALTRIATDRAAPRGPAANRPRRKS